MEKGHLPILGVGPLYVVTIILMTIISITLSATGIIPVITFANFQWIFILIGILCFIIGITLWLKAVIIDRLDTHIIKNELVTTGVYAYVRNPVYSAFMFVCTGVLLIYGNLVLLVLPIIYWGFMTVLMKLTEEKWLEDLYGKGSSANFRCWTTVCYHYYFDDSSRYHSFYYRHNSNHYIYYFTMDMYPNWYFVFRYWNYSLAEGSYNR